MNNFVKLILSFLLLVKAFPGISQELSEIKRIEILSQPHVHSPVRYQNIFLRFYKVFVSPQDGQSCVYAPSCSVYATEAIKKKGIIPGVFAAFDRLTRCHGFAQDHYMIDHQTKLLSDPVR